jgi:hypothetical protein
LCSSHNAALSRLDVIAGQLFVQLREDQLDYQAIIRGG